MRRLTNQLPLFYLFCFLVAGCSGTGGQPTGNSPSGNTGQQQRPPADAGQPVSVTAEQLARDCTANKDAAANKYGNRQVTLEGIISDVQIGPNEPGVLLLEGCEGARLGVPTLVRCAFQASELQRARQMKFVRAQTVKLQGRFPPASEFHADLVVDVGDCKIISVSGPEKPLTLADLSKQLETAGAGTKLVKKDLIVQELPLTIDAPEGSEVKKTALGPTVISSGDRFQLHVEEGKFEFDSRSKIPEPDRLIAKDADMVLWRSFSGSFNFVILVKQGGKEYSAWSASDKVAFSQPDCLLMLKCARTLSQKK